MGSFYGDFEMAVWSHFFYKNKMEGSSCKENGFKQPFQNHHKMTPCHPVRVSKVWFYTSKIKVDHVWNVHGVTFVKRHLVKPGFLYHRGNTYFRIRTRRFNVLSWFGRHLIHVCWPTNSFSEPIIGRLSLYYFFDYSDSDTIMVFNYKITKLLES